MDAIRSRLSRAPLLAVFLFYSVTWGLPMLGFSRLLYPDRPLWIDLVVWPIAGLAFGGAMTAVTSRARRREAGPELESSVSRALRGDHLPEEATWDEWGPVLLRRRATAKSTAVASPLLFGAIAAAGVLLAVLSDGNERVVGVVGVPLFVAVAVGSVVSGRRTTRRIDAFLERLRTDSAS